MRISLWKRWPILFLSIMIAVGISVLGAAFFMRARDTMQKQVRARLEVTAGAAALYIKGEMLDGIQSTKDETKPEFIELVRLLGSMRSLQNVRFAYILRKTDNPQELSFVADGDSLSTLDQLDENHNGMLDPSEEASRTGDIYDIQEIPALQGPAFTQPTSDSDVTYDKWGPLISGYAPVRRADGSVAGVLGIDIRAEDYIYLSQSIFTPLALMIVVFAGIFIAGVVVFLWERRQFSIISKVNAERSGLLRLTFHQLGEPLTIMKWSLDTLRDASNSKELKGTVKDHIVTMDEGIGRLNSIIDTLQQAEKVDLGTIEYIATPSSFRTLLENSVREWKSSADSKNIKLEIDMAKDETFLFDHNMIALILRQVLQNALDYSVQDSTITVHAVKSRSTMTVSVEDHGCGIPAEDMEHLFEKYRRASNAPSHKPDGNGLGLYIARGIVQKAGGDMWVQSILEKGTTVSFTLPIKA